MQADRAGSTVRSGALVDATAEVAEAIAALTGKQWPGVMGDSRSVSGTAPDEDWVCALSRECSEQAELYGHITGRRTKVVGSLSEAFALERPAVVVATFDQLRAQELEQLYEFSRRSKPVGVLAAVSTEQLSQRLYVSGALANSSALLAALPPLPSAALLSFGKDELASMLFDHVSDPDSEPLVVEKILRGPSSILAFQGHSDNVDARLSSRATLCTRMNQKGFNAVSRPANCDLTGYCPRVNQRQEEAFASGKLLSPAAIAARVLLMMSCYVGSPADGAVDPGATLLSQLLQNPKIGAVVASWEIVVNDTNELLGFVAPLLRGRTVGEALSSFYSSATGAQRGCSRYLLFGDPATRVVGQATNADASSARRRSVTVFSLAALRASRKLSVPPADTPVVDFLSARLERLRASAAVAAPDDAAVAESLTVADSAIGELRRLGGNRARYERLLATMLAIKGFGFARWFEDGAEQPEAIERATRCFGCGSAGRLFRVVSRFSVRWLACCAHCQAFYADVPEGSSLVDATFEIAAGNAVVDSLPEGPERSTMLQLQSPLDERTTWRRNEMFDFTSLPAGRSWLSLYAVGDDGVFTLVRMIDTRAGMRDGRTGVETSTLAQGGRRFPLRG